MKDRSFTLLLGTFPLNIYFALEIGSFFNGHALGDDITYCDCGFLQLRTLACLDVAFQLALHCNVLSIDVRLHLPVRTNGQAVATQLDGAFDLSVNEKVLTPGKLPFYGDRPTNVCNIRCLRRVHNWSLLGISFRKCTRNHLILNDPRALRRPVGEDYWSTPAGNGSGQCIFTAAADYTVQDAGGQMGIGAFGTLQCQQPLPRVRWQATRGRDLPSELH